MADEQVLLEYIVKSQDQARGMLQQQVQLLQQMTAGVNALVASQNKAVQSAQANARAAQQQGDSLDKLIRLHERLREANSRVSKGFDAMNLSLQQGSKLSQVQAAWLGSLNTAVQKNSGFMQANGQQWNSLIGQMTVGTTLTPQMVRQFNQLGQAWGTTATGAASTANSLQRINVAAVAVTAAVGALAGTVLRGFISELADATKQSSLFQNTFLGLGTIAKSFGQNMEATTQAAKDLAADGLMSVRDTALTLKNLIASGFNLEQAINLAKGFKDIASFNRQASMDLGYAVTSASEGIKNQNSLLVDNAGLTKNLTIILKEMGLSEQDLAKVQTDVNVRTMLYNGLLKEMGMAAGDAQRYTETFSGSQSKLAVNLQLLQVAIGDKLLPILTQFNNAVSSVVQFLRTSDSAWAGTVKTVAIFTAAFAAAAAAIVSVLGVIGVVTGAIALLGPALAGVTGGAVTLGGVLGMGAGLAGVLATVTTALALFYDGSQKTDEQMTRAKLAAMGYTGSLADMKKQLEDTAAGVQHSHSVWEDLNVLISRNLKNAWDGLKNDLSDIKKAVDDGVQSIKDFVSWLGKIPGVGLIKKGVSDIVDAARSSLSDAANNARMQSPTQQKMAADMIAQLGALTAMTNASAEADRKAKEQKSALEAVNRRYGELIKGQISTTESYNDAVNKLNSDLAVAIQKGMKPGAAMRLPEIVKQAKELASAAREGVAPMNGLAKAIEDRGKAIERQRRLEQEAADHQLEYGNRVRTLSRAFTDQTAGVDSLSERLRLLNAVMAKFGVSFDDPIERLKPFQALMQGIVDEVEKMGAAAPPNFEKIRQAVLRLPGGESPLKELQKRNLEKGTEEVQAYLEKQNKMRLAFAAQEIEVAEKSNATIAKIHNATAEEMERNEIDSLEKRLRAVDRSYAEQLRDIQIFSARGQKELAALIEWYAAAAGAVREAWRKEYYGPTQKDLERTAKLARQRYEEMEHSGKYSAQALSDAWDDAYEKQRQASTKNFRVFQDNLKKSLSGVVELSESLANIAGENQFADMSRWIGSVAGAMIMASNAGDQLEKSMAEFSDGQTAKGFADLAASIAGMVSAMAAATNSGSRLKNALGGAAVGAQIGAKTGSWYGVIAGAIIGAIIGAFRKPEWKKVKDDIARDIGVAISDQLAKSIAEVEKKLHVTRDQAIALNVSAIMEESGASVKKFAGQIDTLFNLMASGGNAGKKAVEELGKVFDTMVVEMDRDMHGLADGAMLAFIQRVKESGQEVKSVTDFLNQMADLAGESLNKVTAGIVGSTVSQYDKLQELVDTTLPDLIQKRNELMSKIAGEKNPLALSKLNMELERTNKALEKAFAEADRLNGGITRFAEGGQEAFDRTGRLIAVTFAAGIGNGKSFLQMLDQIGPSLDTMAKAADQFGLTMSDGLQQLLGLRDLVNNNRELADSIDGLNGLMKSLNNLGVMNVSTFSDLGQTAVDMRQRLVDAGASGDQALALMQPTLQTLWELQQRFGYKTDEATQKLLDEAEAAGQVGKEHMSAQERMVAGIDKMVDRMERLLGYFGVDFPKEAEAGAGTAETATDNVRDSVDEVSRRLQDGLGDWERWGQAAHAAGQEAYEATHGVSYGHSPGGLIDIQQRLEDLKRQWHDMGAAAASGLGVADKYVDALNKVLHELDRVTMSDFDRQLDDIEQRRRSSLDSFVKEMEGAAQELIDIGVAAINRTAELQSRDAVIEERRRQFAEAYLQNKKWAETLQQIQDQLKLEQTTSPMQNELLALQQRKDDAIKAFLESMVNAAQSQIDAGLAALGELYRLQADKIRDAVQKQITDTLGTLHNQLELEQTTDPMQRSLIQLRQQKEDEVKNFLSSMVDASQAQIDEGLRIIDELYRLREAKLQTQDQQVSDATKEIQGGPGTFSWMMQQQEDRNGASAAAIQQALEIAARGRDSRDPLIVQIPIGRKMTQFVVDLNKQSNRNGLTPVQANNVVDRLS